MENKEILSEVAGVLRDALSFRAVLSDYAMVGEQGGIIFERTGAACFSAIPNMVNNDRYYAVVLDTRASLLTEQGVSMLEWLMTESPFSRYILERDGDFVLIDAKNPYRHELFTCMVALRECYEFTDISKEFKRLVGEGIPAAWAWVLAHYTWDHGPHRALEKTSKEGVLAFVSNNLPISHDRRSVRVGEKQLTYTFWGGGEMFAMDWLECMSNGEASDARVDNIIENLKEEGLL